MIPDRVELEIALEDALHNAGNPSFGAVMLDCRLSGGFDGQVGFNIIPRLVLGDERRVNQAVRCRDD